MTKNIYENTIYLEALKQLDEELLAKKVEEAKVQIIKERLNKKWWHKYLPYKIKIIRREKCL